MTSPPARLDSLLDRASGGDTDAFAAFYDLTVERVYTVARVQTASKEGATTRVRDAYLRAWSDLQHKGARDLSPLAWIVSLTT